MGIKIADKSTGYTPDEWETQFDASQYRDALMDRARFLIDHGYVTPDEFQVNPVKSVAIDIFRTATLKKRKEGKE